MAGVALIVGSLAADAFIGDRGGVHSTLVVATVVGLLTTAAGLAIRRILIRQPNVPPTGKVPVDGGLREVRSGVPGVHES
jgi:hypothetical protein